MPKNQQPNLLGITIDNKYKLISVLGEGSFATVYKAQFLSNFSSSKYFAVKALYKAGLNSHQLQAQKNELNFLKTLSDHRNICKLIKHVETESHLFLIMELCDTDLFDLIIPPNSSKLSRQGLSESLAISIFTQLASVLAYSHSKGIYHRDLKPENILIQRDSFTVKLADFGLATDSNISKEFGCGSVRYMSPECLDSKISPDGYSPETNDVWGLAIILLNLLSGKNPWVEPKLSDNNFALYTSERKAIDTLKNQFKISHDLACIISKVFSSDVKNRPSLVTFAESVLRLKSLKSIPVPLPSPSSSSSIPALSNSPPRTSSTLVPYNWSLDSENYNIRNIQNSAKIPKHENDYGHMLSMFIQEDV